MSKNKSEPKSYTFSQQLLIGSRIKKYCKVQGCLTSDQTHPHLSFFRFPSDKQRNEKWIELVGCEYVSPSGYYRNYVCQLHFEPKYLQSHTFHKSLNRFCVPTLNLPGRFRGKSTQVELADVRYAEKVFSGKSLTNRNHLEEPRNLENNDKIILENFDVEVLRKEFHELCDCFLPAELAQEIKSVTSGPLNLNEEETVEPCIFEDPYNTNIDIKEEPLEEFS